MKLRRLLAGGLGAWAGWRIFGPEPQPRFGPGQRRPHRVAGRTVFVGEKEFFVREAGAADAPPLVLVHGWGFDGEMTFHRILEPLAEHFRVVMPDHRNHGKSDWLRGKFEVADLADELAGVLAAVGVERATVFGYSLGGMVTQELARRHPAYVARMILAATAAHPVYRLRPLARVGMWLGRSVARISANEIAAAAAGLMKRAGALDPRHQRWMRASYLRRDPTLFYEAGHAAWRFDSRRWVGRLPQPAMVIVTAGDHIVQPAAQRVLADLISEADVVELAGADHDSILSDPDAYVGLIKGFAG